MMPRAIAKPLTVPSLLPVSCELDVKVDAAMLVVVVVVEVAVAVVVTRPTVSVPPYDVAVVVSDPIVVVTRDVIVWVKTPTVTVVVTVDVTPTPRVPAGVSGPPGPVIPGGYGPPGPVPPPPSGVRVTSEPSALVLTTVRGPSHAQGPGAAVSHQVLFLRLDMK